MGWSAIPIGGSTIHRATGIGMLRKTQDFGRMWKKPNRGKWRSAKVWIIDEVSMVSAELLDYLEQTIRQIRGDESPFGGLQVHMANSSLQAEKGSFLVAVVSQFESQLYLNVYLNIMYLNCISVLSRFVS